MRKTLENIITRFKQGDLSMRTYITMALCVFTFALLPLATLAQETSLSTVASDNITTTPETEAERVKRELIEYYPNIDFGREVDEPDQARWLFEDEVAMQNLLGIKPRFVYNPKNLPDPMVIPWVRQNIIAAELLREARELIRLKEYDRALQILTLIVNSYAGTSSYREAREELDKVDIELDKMRDIPIREREGQRIVLPPWIYENTKAVIWEPVNPIVLVGDHMLFPRPESCCRRIAASLHGSSPGSSRLVCIRTDILPSLLRSNSSSPGCSPG